MVLIRYDNVRLTFVSDNLCFSIVRQEPVDIPMITKTIEEKAEDQDALYSAGVKNNLFFCFFFFFIFSVSK